MLHADVGGKSEESSTPTKDDILRSQGLQGVDVFEIFIPPNLTRDDAQLDAVLEQIQPRCGVIGGHAQKRQPIEYQE